MILAIGLSDKVTLRRLSINATQLIFSEWFSGWGFLGLYIPIIGDDPLFMFILVRFKIRCVEKDTAKTNLYYKVGKSLSIE